METALPLLVSWQNFFMITGTAAATLTGLMFIVITLMAGIERREAIANAGVTAFNTPTVMNFGSVLLLAVLLSIPWQTFTSVKLVLGLLGLGEIIYFLSVIPWMRRIPNYRTPLKDWLGYLVTPLGAYIVLVVASVILSAKPVEALYLIAVVMVSILFIGIRNAWDLVTFLAIFRTHPGG